ncbi:hypothetical protein KFE25_002961 [Diacronema lutheri]|uniref:Uncharacterized protein n=1 Tax=Diacronema lutheri TaxID=2081491 RepID=A0A8J6CAL9_DIALT|nr:hypothetical protein KFE25_002961 [Diacronema lutheri]
MGRLLPAGFLLGLLSSVLVAQTVDHYATLGIKRTASLAEVKRAYRAKALTSHPDKARPGEAEAATDAFRRIAEAYETLSDPQERRRYDAGGGRSGGGGSGGFRGGGGGAQREWFWSSAGGFGRGDGRHSWRNAHHEHFLRPEVRRAQERPIKLRSLGHLRSSALGDDGRTERAVLLALTDGTEACAATLKFETQFPAPFAGWSDATMGSGLWWEDVLQTYTGDMKADTKLGTLFGASAGGACPTIVFVRKGEALESFEALRGASARHWKAFSDWVWDRLRTVVTIRNLHHSAVQLWWATGRTAHKLSLLESGQVVEQHSFISHRFFAWDARTEGTTLADDTLLATKTLSGWEHEELVVRTRCVDGHGACGFWRQRGECVRNPAFMDAKCQRACGKCPPEEACRDVEEACPTWAAEGHCAGNAAWMLPNCRRSCGACEGGDSDDAARARRKDEV